MTAEPPAAAETVDRYGQAPHRRDPGSRGRLTISERVVERIATIAAGQVPGVVESGGTVGAVFGRQYPNVHADVAGDRATVRVDLAVRWPTSADEAAAAVRDQVRDQLLRYAGLTADRVDVTVAAVEPRRLRGQEQDERRVR